MTLYWVAGQVVDDQQGSVPAGSMRVNMFRNQAQYGSQEFAWDPSNRYFSGGIQSNAPAYLTTLLGRLDRQRRGEQLPWYEAEELAQWEATARAMPTRDISTLRAGWQGDLGGSWGGGATEGNPEWWSLLDPGSPDAGPIMLNLRDKVQHGSATPQERQLYQEVATMAADWDYRASVPQESDANPFGMGDNLFGALMMLGMGASGGAAAAALATGGLTLGSVGGLAGVASGMTSMMGEALDEDVLRKMGISLGAVGGAAGLAALASTGINTVGDLLKVVQKAYGVGSKAYGLATGAGSTPDRPGGGGGMADTRTDFIRGGGNTGSTGSILDSLGPLLGGVIGAVGTGMQLSDVSRYMDQLKTRYGQEEGVKNLIDEAYNLAKARYETYYAETREEQAQKQAQYQDAAQKYQTRYQQQQQVFDRQQQQFQTIEHQTAMDRDEQYKNHQANRARVDQAYDRQVQEAQQERDFQLQEHGVDRTQVMQSYNRRVAEAQQDRQKEYSTFDSQLAQYQAREAQRDLEVAQDRDKQYHTFDTQFALAQKNQALREAQAAENRQFERTSFEEQRGKYDEGYARQVGETAADRAFQKDLWGDQYSTYKTDYGRRVGEAAEERALDKAGYEARHAIGADLRDPAKLAAGAQAVYNPLSAAARDRINVQSEEEMARRGVAGGGMYSNLLAAKAFAPQEAQLWQNAMQNYMAGQTGALTAYGNVDLAGSPEYRMLNAPEFSTSPEYRTQNAPSLSTAPGYDWRQAPEFVRSGEYRLHNAPQFTDSPEYRQMTLPNLAGSPGFTPLGQPQFERSRMDSVPGAPRYDQMPNVPQTTKADGAPAVPGSTNAPYYPRPYSPYGAVDGSGGGGGGPGGALANAGALAAQLGKLLGGDAGLIQKVLGLLGKGGNGITANADGYNSPIGPGLGWDAGGYDYQNFDYDTLGDIDYSVF